MGKYTYERQGTTFEVLDPHGNSIANVLGETSGDFLCRLLNTYESNLDVAVKALEDIIKAKEFTDLVAGEGDAAYKPDQIAVLQSLKGLVDEIDKASTALAKIKESVE